MTGMKRYIVALAALLLLGCGPKEDQFVDAKAAAASQARGELLLDIREPDSYKEFSIPNSTHIPFGRLKYRLEELAAYKDKPVMLIDSAGVRAPRAWEMLKKAGFSQVSIVQGGARAWQEAGLPVDTLNMQMDEARQKKEQQQREIEQLEWELEQLKKQD